MRTLILLALASIPAFRAHGQSVKPTLQDARRWTAPTTGDFETDRSAALSRLADGEECAEAAAEAGDLQLAAQLTQEVQAASLQAASRYRNDDGMKKILNMLLDHTEQLRRKYELPERAPPRAPPAAAKAAVATEEPGWVGDTPEETEKRIRAAVDKAHLLKVQREAKEARAKAEREARERTEKARQDRLELMEADVAARINKGLDYLKSRQTDDGSWSIDGSPNGYWASSPYIIACVTEFALEALEAGGVSPAKGADKANTAIHNAALGATGGGVTTNDRVYGLACGLTAAARAGDAAKMKKYGEVFYELKRRGGAYYHYQGNGYDSSASFQTAMMVVSLVEAKEKGAEFPDDLLSRTVDALASKKEDGGWRYGGRGTTLSDASRAPVCEYAMLKAGRGSVADLKQAVASFAADENLVASSTTVNGSGTPHSGPGGRSDYFYIFGFYWTSRGLKELASDPSLKKEDLAAAAEKLIAPLSNLQKPDGSWEDSATYAGPIYGTAYATMALANLREVAKLR